MGFGAVRGLAGLGEDIVMVPLFGHPQGRWSSPLTGRS